MCEKTFICKKEETVCLLKKSYILNIQFNGEIHARQLSGKKNFLWNGEYANAVQMSAVYMPVSIKTYCTVI